MGVPVAKFLKYEEASSAEYTEISTGGVYTTNIITANNYGMAAAFRVELISDSEFHIDSLKLWANDTIATINNSSQDLGQGYDTEIPATWWSMVYIYTSTNGDLVSDDAIQTSVVTCPSSVFTTGNDGWSILPADFRGDTHEDGVDLLQGAVGGLDSKLSNGQYVAYTKPIGISFKPNSASQYGHYTNFSVRVDFDFS
jgi:hypothetical protein